MPRFSYANVMATVAVFIALGGTGYAISALPKNSVKSKQIAKNAVKSSELSADSVRSAEVLDGSLLSADFAAGQLPQGKPGPKGAPGPTFAAVQDVADPVAAPDSVTAFNFPVTTPSAGHLFVMFTTSGNGGLKIDCSAGNPTVGLYLDDVPVPDTKVDLTDNVAMPITKFAVTAGTVAAGDHLLSLGADCAGGTMDAGTISSTRSFAAILLG